MHKAEITITRMSEGKTNKLFVGSMSDDRALELASKIVSEGFIFSVRSLLESNLTSAFQSSGPDNGGSTQLLMSRLELL